MERMMVGMTRMRRKKNTTMVQMMRTNARNYIHAKRGDMPAERQVTWRGCARDWITNGQLVYF